MKIFLYIIKYYSSRFMRYLYWLFRLLQAKKGKKLSLQFPVKVEGNGSLIIGNNCKIKKNVYFACGSGSIVKIGNNCRIDENVQLIAGKNAQIEIGDNSWIMKNTIIRTGNKYQLGNDVAIATNCAIFSRENGHEGILTIENGTHIGDYTIIDTSDDLHIEKEVAIGPNCVIYTHDHKYDNEHTAAWKGGVIKGSVRIKSGSWIASSVTILPKVIIEKRTVIAAGAVVTKSTNENSIYGGVPAKLIKEINA